MHTRAAWSDYFTGTPSTQLSNEYTNQQNPSASSIYVLKSLFRSMLSTSSGGALYCSSTTCLLVESTSFFSCRTSSQLGGAICLSASNSQYVLYGVCGYDCYSTYSGSLGQFSYNSLSTAVSNKNYINYSSIARCVSTNSNSHYMICHHSGNNSYPSVNISMNKCNSRSGLYCCPSSDSTVTGSFSYTTFADNVAIAHTCISLCTSGAKFNIKSCNILRNTQGNINTEGTIASWGNLMIDDSCILENTATNIFFQASSSYTITISRCTVDSTSNNGYLTTRNTITKSFILALNHMSTQNCHAGYDSASYLTPIIQSPSSSKRQIHCYTFVKCFNKSPLSDFFLLTYISSVLMLPSQ
jgi:hypothetical protein